MNIPLQSLIIILTGHWIGDFLLQGNTIATQKSKSIGWLAIHVLVYTAVILCISFYLFSWVDALKFSLLNGFLHFVTDLFTGKVSYRYKENPRIFYPIMGFDQLIHSVTLIATTYFISG